MIPGLSPLRCSASRQLAKITSGTVGKGTPEAGEDVEGGWDMTYDLPVSPDLRNREVEAAASLTLGPGESDKALSLGSR